MSWEAWQIFALFWVLFVTTPGPNAVNCISTAMTYGFKTSLITVLAILCQASLFLGLSAVGISALLLASPMLFQVASYIGAGFLIYLGVRAWIVANHPITQTDVAKSSIFTQAFMIATINPKSIAGYFAAFTQFIQPNVPIAQQMWVITPTALTLTSLSYMSYCALGAGLGRMALGAIMNIWLRRSLAACFVIYGVLLALLI